MRPDRDRFPVQAHIIHCEGADPAADRIVRENDRMRLIVVFVSDPDDAAAVATDLVERDDVQLIELDGGLGLSRAARVVEAVAGRAAVGTVMFGAESLASATAYGERYRLRPSSGKSGAGGRGRTGTPCGTGF